jgi:hypothetical protein
MQDLCVGTGLHGEHLNYLAEVRNDEGLVTSETDTLIPCKGHWFSLCYFTVGMEVGGNKQFLVLMAALTGEQYKESKLKMRK